LINSRLGLFSAACSGSTIFSITLPRHPFSLSYGVILPSSLTGVIPLVLGFSPRLPVSVCGTATLTLGSSFSRQREISSVRYFSFRSPSRPRICGSTCFTILPPSSLGRTLPTVRCAYPSVSLLPSVALKRYRNINLLSITYASWPRLRNRLTLSGRAFLRKP
jgi:hypothetical protein